MSDISYRTVQPRTITKRIGGGMLSAERFGVLTTIRCTGAQLPPLTIINNKRHWLRHTMHHCIAGRVRDRADRHGSINPSINRHRNPALASLTSPHAATRLTPIKIWLKPRTRHHDNSGSPCIALNQGGKTTGYAIRSYPATRKPKRPPAPSKAIVSDLALRHRIKPPAASQSFDPVFLRPFKGTPD